MIGLILNLIPTQNSLQHKIHVMPIIGAGPNQLLIQIQVSFRTKYMWFDQSLCYWWGLFNKFRNWFCSYFDVQKNMLKACRKDSWAQDKMLFFSATKKVRGKSRECHNHKPKPFKRGGRGIRKVIVKCKPWQKKGYFSYFSTKTYVEELLIITQNIP